jgi:hypothetical protein
MFDGVAVYLLAHLGFRLRNIGSVDLPRAVAAGVLLLLPHLVDGLPAWPPLPCWRESWSVPPFEVVRYREARDRIRHRTT